MRNVRYAILVERASFPNEWKRKNPPPMGDPGTKGAGFCCNREGETKAHREWDRGQQHQGTTMDRRRDMEVRVSRVNRDQDHHKGGGGGIPLKGGSTKGEMRIMVGSHHLVDSSLQGDTCPETGAQVGKTNVTQS